MSQSKLINRISSGVLLVTIAGVALLFTVTRTTDAASTQDFRAGNIIDDGVFYNKNAMSAAQIQDFLNRLIPNCDTWGTEPSEYGGGTRAEYAASRGLHPPPYVCLNNYHENPTTGETSFEKGGGAFAGGISAAQIIYNASQQYGINPQVLLVLLKKESAGPLTSDTWPLKSQYKYAMGYACPDSGPDNSANCDDSKAGFYKQMMLAAWQLKYYRDHPNDYRYSIGWNDIQYSPDPSCGTKSVNIENMATLSLYIYTPYTPNDAALANYPGTAPCGAYGNRNFFMFFSEWFGTTHGNVQIDIIKADADITKVYNTYNSQLGSPTSDRLPEFDSNPRVWQNFTNGTIIWTSRYGAQPIFHSSILSRWRTIGGSVGLLGVPAGTQYTESDGRVWQQYQSGMVIYSSSTGAWEVLSGPIADKWRSLGGSTGSLGKPKSGVVVANNLRYQEFESGFVARKNTSTPAYAITGQIASYWASSRSSLLAPTTDTIFETTNNRHWQYFSGGNLVINSNLGTWTITSGAFHDSWKIHGGSNGKLGKPSSNTAVESDGRVWQAFEKGYLIRKQGAASAYGMQFGDIYNRWHQLGGSTGQLGAPTGNLYLENDGRQWQNFSSGTVIWSTATGAWEIQGGFYDYWKSAGGSTGSLGKPISGKTTQPDGSLLQNFEKGKLSWSPNSHWTVTAR